MASKVFSTRDVRTACARGRDVVDTYKNRCDRPAAVFDVDETLLLNHPSDDGRYRANPPVVALYDHVDAGFDTYIVTARRKSDWSMNYLKKQLAGIGVRDPKRIYMVTKAYDRDPSASRFKRDARERIQTKHGAQIILNVGDQASDMFLTGEYDRGNEAFAQTLMPDHAYGIVHPNDPALLALKLPAAYTVP